MLTFEPNWATFPKHYSTWLGVAAIIFDSAYVFTDAMSGRLSPEAVIMINAAVAVGMKVLQLLKQSIPVAPAVKKEMEDTLEVLPTTKPETVATPPAPRRQTIKLDQFNALVDMRASLIVEAKINEIEERIAKRKRKPTTPRTKALSEQFNPPQMSTTGGAS